MKSCLLSLAIAAIWTSFLSNPLYSISIICGFSLIAVALVFTLERNYSLTGTIYITAAASLLSKCLTLLILIHLLGFNPLIITPENITQGLNKILYLAKLSGIATQDIQPLSTVIPTALRTVNYLLPAGFVIAAFVDSLANYALVAKISTYIGKPIKTLPRFEQIRIPMYIAWLFVGSSLTMTYLPGNSHSYFAVASFNIYIFSLFALIVQAISGVFCLANKTAYPLIIKNIAVILIISNPIFSKLAALFAIYYISRYLRRSKLL